MNSLCVQNVEFLNVEPGGTYSNDSALNRLVYTKLQFKFQLQTAYKIWWRKLSENIHSDDQKDMGENNTLKPEINISNN
jgi:hypothetical protein